MKNDCIFTRPENEIGRLSGIVTVPSDFDKTKETLPVIVFLHGSGEAGDGSEAQVQRVRAHGIPKYFGADADYKGVRVITVSPQCPENVIWDDIPYQLKDYIDAAVAEFGGDKTRVSLTGLSMGGFGTWSQACLFPDAYVRLAPICGGGVNWRVDDRFRDKEIRVFHSVDDDSVPFDFSVIMVKQAVEAGADVEFTAYTREGHGCWNRAYEQTDLIEWLAFAL